KDMKYLIFGQEREELFAAHHITVPPNFDQVLSLQQLSGDTLRPIQSTRNIIVLVGRTDAILNKIKEGEQFVGLFNPGRRNEQDMQFVATTEWYFETEDLQALSSTPAAH